MYYSINLQTDRVKCTSTQTQTVTCQVAYPALRTDEEVSATNVSACKQFFKLILTILISLFLLQQVM